MVQKLTLSQVIDNRFSTRTRPNVDPVISVIGTSSALFLRSNPMRLAWTLTNLSANEIYIGSWEDVSVSKGIQVAAHGGGASAIFDEDFNQTGYDWYIVADGSSSRFTTVEILSD